MIADHPVLPPPGSLPPDSEELRAVLGEVAKGSHSTRAGLIRQVAAARHVAFEELVRRAAFLLACVTLPESGTHYEVLGVSPRASRREIRQRWATLIQRYHPDHAGPEGGLEDQARRLIEAYQTLRDPERRRRYDAELSRARGGWQVARPVEAPGSWRRLVPARRWRWAPAVIAAFGVLVVVAMVRWTAQAPSLAPFPAPRALSPAHPEGVPTEPIPVRPPPSTAPIVTEGEPTEPHGPPASRSPLPSLLGRMAALDPPAATSARDANSGIEAVREVESQAPSPAHPASPPVATPPATVKSPATASTIPDGGHGTHRPVRDSTIPSEPSGPKRTAPTMRPPGTSEPEQRLPRNPARTAAVATPAPTPRDKNVPGPESWSSLIEAFRGAYERKDVGVLNGLFADDVRERTTVGRNAVRRLYMANFQVLDDIRYEVSQMTAQAGPKEGEVLVHGRFRIRAVEARSGSRLLDVSGPIRWTLRREGEALRIVGIDYEAGRR